MPGGFALSKASVPVFDTWDERATFTTAQLDKVDVTANVGDVLLQVQVRASSWEPIDGVIVRRGLFRSIPGLSQMYPPGPTGVRFKRGRAGAAATVDFDAYAVA